MRLKSICNEKPGQMARLGKRKLGFDGGAIKDVEVERRARIQGPDASDVGVGFGLGGKKLGVARHPAYLARLGQAVDLPIFAGLALAVASVVQVVFEALANVSHAIPSFVKGGANATPYTSDYTTLYALVQH